MKSLAVYIVGGVFLGIGMLSVMEGAHEKGVEQGKAACVPKVLPVPKRIPPPPQRESFMHAGELVAWWEAWDRCDGPHCID